jgi:DNA-binding transcriptional ArsR family regulator
LDDKQKTDKTDPKHGLMNISLEQHKLLANALRIKILHTLEVPRTAKQVADILGQTPGNVHYHIQRLYDGKLLELVETREVNGIMEKYYKAYATWFNVNPKFDPHKRNIQSHLLLTGDEFVQFERELLALVERWEKQINSNKQADLHEYAVQIYVAKTEPAAETESTAKPESGEGTKHDERKD